MGAALEDPQFPRAECNPEGVGGRGRVRGARRNGKAEWQQILILLYKSFSLKKIKLLSFYANGDEDF